MILRSSIRDSARRAPAVVCCNAKSRRTSTGWLRTRRAAWIPMSSGSRTRSRPARRQELHSYHLPQARLQWTQRAGWDAVCSHQRYLVPPLLPRKENAPDQAKDQLRRRVAMATWETDPWLWAQRCAEHLPKLQQGLSDCAAKQYLESSSNPSQRRIPTESGPAANMPALAMLSAPLFTLVVRIA